MIEYKLIYIKRGKIHTVKSYNDYEEFEENLWLACNTKPEDITIAVIISTPKR